ncbi:complex I intermediate-associated protein 30-domain-containing protein [Cladochytrium replicatum]|nr:complex I intermediate-associated protein 30-domain-containing protein [Cladochytrium replicatum]
MPLTLFHRPRLDTTLYRYLAIRARGDSRHWFLNLQADSLYPTHLWQHWIYFKTPGQWETVMIPFQDFVLTANGFVQARQIELDRAKVKTVGFSVVRQPREFSLEVDWIAALNTSTTLGDYDVLEKGTEIDEKGVVRRLKPGETLEYILGSRL